LIAVNTIRAEPHYRRAAFDAGLESAGYQLRAGGEPKTRADVILLWNLHGGNELRAREWEAKGGTVLVCENGYIGRDAAGQQLYAIGVHGHNGSGWFPVGDDDRFAPLGIQLAPWRESDGYILVCGQRGIGSRQMASPPQWEDRTRLTLKERGETAIHVRRHPGRQPPHTTLEEDLAGARACVVWSSASGVKALTLGIPVVYCAPHWICAGAAGQSLGMVNEPVRDDALRLSAMRRMAHAQWTVAEIEAGEPFRRILANIGSATW
jgi:hypothetical protein